MNAPRLRNCRLILIAAVFVVFGRLLLCDFTWWDDPHTIHHNPLMNPVRWDTFTHNWSEPTASIYIPLTYTLWALIALVARVDPDATGITLNPTFFHGASILIHAGGTLAVFALLRRLVKHDLAALIGALFWAVHPLQVESLGWVSGMKDVLSGSLVMAAMLAYVRYRDEGKGRWYWISLVVYVLAMLAKPAAFTMPLLLITLDLAFYRVSWKQIARSMAPFVIVTLPIAYIARAAQETPAANTPTWMHPLMVGDALTFYGRKIIAPVHLLFDYSRNVEYLRTQPILYYAWVFPLAVALGVLWWYRRARRDGKPLSPLVAIGLLWFVFAPLHVLGLTRFDFQQISTVADHYMYVALIGPALVMAWCIVRWPKLAGVSVAVICVYGATAAWQTTVWQNDDALLNYTLAHNPRSWTAYTNRAVYEGMMNRFDLQEQDTRRAHEVAPNNPTVSINLISAYVSAGQKEKADQEAAQLIELYRLHWKTMAAGPAGAHGRIAKIMVDSNHIEWAEKYIREGLKIDPNDELLKRLQLVIVWKQAATNPAIQPGIK